MPQRQWGKTPNIDNYVCGIIEGGFVLFSSCFFIVRETDRQTVTQTHRHTEVIRTVLKHGLAFG